MMTATQNWQNSAAAYQSGAGSNPIVFLTIGKSSLTDSGGYPRVFSNAVMPYGNFYPWLDPDGAVLSQSVNDLEGSSDLSNVSLRIIDGDLTPAFAHAITNDIASGYSFDGKTAIIWLGFQGLALTDFLQMATMIVDHTDYEDDTNVLKFEIRDNSLLTNGYSFIYAQNGFLTSSNNPATVEGAPFDPAAGLIVTALEDAGFTLSLINTASLSNLNSNVYFGSTMSFLVTYPPVAKDWVENEILKPLGCYWFWNNLGQFTVVSLLPAVPPTAALSLTNFDIHEETFPIPIESSKYTSAMTYRFDMDSNGQNAESIFEEIYAAAANLYGISQSRVITSRGVKSALGGYRLANLMAQMIFSRYGLKPLTMKIRGFAPCQRLEMGDKILISHPLVPNGKFPAALRTPGSPLGIQGTLWEVLGTQKNLDDLTVDLDLLDVSWQLPANAWLIAPDVTPAYSLASSAQKAANMFFCNSSDEYSDNSPAHTLW